MVWIWGVLAPECSGGGIRISAAAEVKSYEESPVFNFVNADRPLFNQQPVAFRVLPPVRYGMPPGS